MVQHSSPMTRGNSRSVWHEHKRIKEVYIVVETTGDLLRLECISGAVWITDN